MGVVGVPKASSPESTIKMGSGWLVIVRFPDRPEIEVPGFATEADAQNWVTNDSWAWLKKLGYGD
jgi:hypothetical protein